MRQRLPLIVVTLLSLSGCTAEQIYASSQPARLKDCERLPRAEREACLNVERETYSEREKRTAQ
ncbi:hypothetical protein ED208_14970 [Stagnimonas aquatica]|uniref:Uncharacterized protein n=1 Tax=Stagnimonas aquatica TaxID=2689987 RepID=A0A3N0V203_9GAMM|nr:hypothetical protein [Stagnimonas aquatica]ROH86735.1 hypothetical protein ED208_14970 [Stagnimonas aquatica]